jgi:hypothetical protein
MKNRKNNSAVVKVGCGLLAGMLAPSVVHACACGCGVFDVGTSSMFPTLGDNGMVFLQYDYQDQNRNWRGTSQAPAANNDDKELTTDFTTLGVQYMFNSSWGAQIEVPYDYRTFKTDTGGGNIATRNWSQLGDIRLEGIYTGFFADQSAGVTFGVKLPTGDFNFDPDVVDRDSQLGTGSTDILLGGFYRGNITKDEKWDWFAQALLDVPVLIQDQYRPGVELDTAAGIDYKGFSIGRVKISPVAQVIASYRSSDSGANASGGANDDPDDGVSSGYERVMLSPGIEFHIHPVKIYADVEVPVFQNFTGNQLAAPVLFKVSMSYMF